MSPMVPGTDYDEEELRQLYGAGFNFGGYSSQTNNSEDDEDEEEDGEEDEDDSPEPNYACATCGEKTHISEHKRRAPAWCNDCGEIKSHERLSQKS